MAKTKEEVVVESKEDFQQKMQDFLQKFNFKDAKGEFKLKFKEFLSAPDKFGASEELTKSIMGASEKDKEVMLKLFIKSAVKKYNELKTAQSAELFMEDLKDGFEQNLDKGLLKSILKNPGKSIYSLEPETITYLSNLSDTEKTDLLDKIANNEHLKPEFFDDFGDKLKDFIGTTWEKLSPVVSKLARVLIDIGSKMLAKLVEQRVEGELGEVLKESVLETGDAFEDTIKETSKKGDKEKGSKVEKVTKDMEKLTVTHEEKTSNQSDEVEVSGAEGEHATA